MSDDSQTSRQSDSNWPPRRPDPKPNGEAPVPSLSEPPLPASFRHDGRRALSGISALAFGLGTTFGISTLLSVWLASNESEIWRVAHFMATLSLFHFLEFYATARWNPADAGVSSFLLSANGTAYNIAHLSALMDFGMRMFLLPELSLGSWLERPAWLPTIPAQLVIAVGIALEVLGQTVRTAAMAEAGQSFNHLVQSKKKDNHVLITTGVYRIFRHPSYFGFFWWGLGTQLVLGNVVGFCGYALVLWKFFSRRIAREEPLLLKFFGDEYAAYRARTPVQIPFIK